MGCEVFLELTGAGLRLEVRGDFQEVDSILKQVLTPELLGRLQTLPPPREPEAPAGVPEVSGHEPPTAAELRRRAKLRGNKEIATFAVYYLDIVSKQVADTDSVKRLLKEELREGTMLKALGTYLNRAKAEGWITQDGDTWRMTKSGLDEVHRWLGGA